MHKTINPILSFSIIGGCSLVLLSLVFLLNSATAKISADTNMTSVTSTVSKPKTYTGAILSTSKGAIEVAFFDKKAPLTVLNFVKLAKADFYNTTKFHRVIKGFMIQGGDPFSKTDDVSLYGTGGPGYKFDDEINDEKMVRGVIAMANSGPNSNGSQFFIMVGKEASWLNGKHTVFGKVVSGMDVVDAINAVQTKNNVPVVPVVLYGVTLK